MVSPDFGPVVHKLELIFLLNQGAVTAVDSKAIAKVADSTGLTNLADILPVAARLSHQIGWLV